MAILKKILFHFHRKERLRHQFFRNQQYFTSIKVIIKKQQSKNILCGEKAIS